MSATPTAIIGDPIKNSSIVAEVGCPAPLVSQSTNSDAGQSHSSRDLPGVANSPDGFDWIRDFFPGCDVAPAPLPRYLPMVGPLTPTPGLTLAQAVEGRAA